VKEVFVKISKFQAWFERTKRIEWKPHLEKQCGSVMIWFLNLHLVID